MAFRVPTQAPRRQTSYSHSERPPALDVSSSLPHIPDDESTQWVLFSPSQDPSNTTRTRSASTERPSRLSDFGSFGTPTRSVTGVESAEDEDEDEDQDEVGGGDGDGDDGDDGDYDDGGDALESLDEDGTELDSLDDGLHAFPDTGVAQVSPSSHSLPRWDQGLPAVLPAHDGLGSFLASSQPVQEQLWQHEQFNPRHRSDLRPRRMSSIQRQLNSVAESEDVDVEHERWKRIENWRMDQSRALMHEVERETRRRRRNSLASWASDRGGAARSTGSGRLQDIPESPNDITSSESQNHESLWQRITRKVIRDLIGIDDFLLSVILGESLPEEEEEEKRRREQQQQQQEYRSDETDSASDGPFDMNAIMKKELDSAPDDTQQHWQAKLLQRIARELGFLIHQFVGHPGAFATYRQVSDGISNEYAGMPVGRSTERDGAQAHFRSGARTISTAADSADNVASTSSPHFSPTLRDPSATDHAAQWGIEDDVDHPHYMTTEDPLSESARLHQEREYWERELDVMMVFRYLRNRFSGRGNNDNSNDDNNNNNNNRNTTTPTSTTHSYNIQDPSRRAAIIRQHHPLVAHAHSRSRSQTQAQIRRQIQLQQYTSPLSPQAAGGGGGGGAGTSRQHLRRTSSSCASQSAKLSAISSKKTLTGSSRNYWDIGGSVESGSAISPVAAGVGGWGEV